MIPSGFDLEVALRALAQGDSGASDRGDPVAVQLSRADVLLDTSVDAAYGLRAASGLAERQIVLTSGAMMAVIDVETVDVPDDAGAPGMARIRGEVSGAEVPVVVQLVDSGGVEQSMCVCDEWGRFELTASEGRFEIVFCDAVGEITAELRIP